MMTQAAFEAMLDTPTLAVPFTTTERAALKTMAIEYGTLEAPKAVPFTPTAEQTHRVTLSNGQTIEVSESGRLLRAQPGPVAQPAQVESAFVDLEDSDVIARTMRGQLACSKRKAFILAGNAIFTLRSKATQTRFTYKVVQSDPAKCRPGSMPVFFVSLLNGADNTGDFAYIGTIFADGFRVTRKSRVAADAPSAIAFSWFMKHLEDSRVEVWHEGRCGRCGRTLTVPESIESGLGPICASK